MTSSPRRLCKCHDGGGWGCVCASSASLQKACCPRDLLLTPVHVHRRELREKIQPEILELIKQQRLNRLCEGSSFRKIGNRRRQGELRAWALGRLSLLPGAAALRGAPARAVPAGSRQGMSRLFAPHVPRPLPELSLLTCLSSLVFQSVSGTAAWP